MLNHTKFELIPILLKLEAGQQKYLRLFWTWVSSAQELQSKIYSSSIFGSWIARIGVWLAAVALIIGFFSIFIPLAYSVSREYICCDRWT